MDFLFNNNWVWDLDWDFDWVWHFDFLDDWNFHDFVFWHFLVVMFVNCMDGHFHASDMMFTMEETR